MLTINLKTLLVEDNTAEEVISLAASALAEYGVSVPYSTWEPSTALLVAEAVNYAAKTINDDFYALKARVIDAAIALGCTGGWGDGVFHLRHPDVGVACFHDPMGEIKTLGFWDEPWSGIPRQPSAFLMLQNKSVLRLYKEATDPDGSCYGMKMGVVNRCVKRLIAA